MPENTPTLDLRQLILLIQERKQTNAHLCLDQGCRLTFDDPKPLVKAINSITVYLQGLSEGEISIDLDAHQNKDQLVFIVHTSKLDAPALNPEIEKAIQASGGILETEFIPGKYFKVQLTWKK